MKNLNSILMVLIGGIMYGTMSSFVKLSYTYGFTAAELAFFQAFFAAFLLGFCTLFVIKKVKIACVTKKQYINLLFAGSFIGLTNYFYYLSVSYISASLAIVILMQFTWISLLLEWIFFSKKPLLEEIITVVLILFGTIMASGLFNHDLVLFSFNKITLLSSLTYALYIITNSRIGKNICWQFKSTLIISGSALTIFIVNYKTIIYDNHFNHDFNYYFILLIFLLAIIGTTIPTALFSIGIPKIGASISAILMTVELPVAILCASIVLNEKMDYLQMIGIVIMLMAISLMNFYKTKRANIPKRISDNIVTD